MSKNWLWVIPAVIIGSYFNAKRRKEEREQMKAAEEEIEKWSEKFVHDCFKVEF